MIYRNLCDSDKDEILILEMSQPYGDRYYHTPMKYKSILRMELKGVVAEEDGEIVGYTIGHMSTGKSFYIEYTYVCKEHRKKGIYTELAKRFEKMIDEMMVKSVYLHTRVDNLVIQNMRKSMGYKIEKVIPEFYTRWKVDAVLMRKTY